MQVVLFMSRKWFWNLWFYIILGWHYVWQISIFFCVLLDHLAITQMTNCIPSSDDDDQFEYFFFFYESLKCLVPWLQLGKCLCLVFEAQEDQSETSQQTAASDEEQETENQVLSDQMSVGLLAAGWAISISYS